MPSPSIQDYIKAIYKEQGERPQVSTQRLATAVAVSAPAASKMLNRLARLHLVEHLAYHGVRLTPAGTSMALEIIRHHRLIERYLVDALNYSWDEVHQEAERLEHHISERFEERIDSLLGRPQTCPHGDPIPTRAGAMEAVSNRSLADCAAPADLIVRRVTDENPELLRYLKEIGLVPGARVTLLDREPFGGAFLVRIGADDARVAPGAAEQVFVDRDDAGAGEPR